MKRPPVGTADLVLIRAAFPSPPWEVIVGLLGREERPQGAEGPVLPRQPPEGPTAANPQPTHRPELPSDPWPAAAEECLFWRATGYTARTVQTTEEILAERPAQSGRLEWRAKKWLPAPRRDDLCPWPVLVPRLRAGLNAPSAAGPVNWARVVDETAQGRPVCRLPRLPVRRWGECVLVILDRSDRLVPYWGDQAQLLTWLQRVIPEDALEVVAGSAPDELPDGGGAADLRPDTVLVLGDLGCLQEGEPALPGEWEAWGRALREAGGRPLALVPCATARVPGPLRHTFAVQSWQRLPQIDVTDPALRRETADHLLRLLAPAVRIEPGLLRAARKLLTGPGDAGDDASLEATVWQHPDVVSRHVTAATIDPGRARDVWRPQFEQLPEEARRDALELIRGWRQPLPPEVWLQEVAHLAPRSRALFPEDWEDAQNALRSLAAGVIAPDTGPSLPAAKVAAIRDYFARAVTRLPNGALGNDEVGQIHRTLLREFQPGSPLPATWDPIDGPRGPTTRTLEVRQTGEELTFAPHGMAGAGGSLLGLLRTTTGEVRVDSGLVPAWADAWGRDRYGEWVTIRIGSVTQRLRRVPAGRFLMGSPDTEEGRWDDEGPQHEVEITRGFWLFDTPCTQALWEAVMGANPSHFKGDRRPVEQVSWDDCQAFVEKLNGLVPGLELALSTEAQWEYACRAETLGPRYGALDEVAWHDGNSAGETHEVGLKEPNGWGLYDMLGNVYEWCHDEWHRYTGDTVINLINQENADTRRIFRGGCWYGTARYVRAAYRLALDPSHRDRYLGFRCVSSGRSFQGGVESPDGTEAVKMEGEVPISCPFPRAERIVFRTDLEEVTLERTPPPAWATEVGRDRFGLWARFEVRGPSGAAVSQRLRWVPPGRFMMGSPESEEGRIGPELPWINEGPQHEVVINRGFWLFDTPCAQALWVAVMGEEKSAFLGARRGKKKRPPNPSHFKGERHPVEQVSFEDVMGFLTKLNGLVAGLDSALPTEAQWEYACRAGTAGLRYGALDDVAWHDGNSDTETHDVGLKEPNGWGLYDMLGNIWEWCHDGTRIYTNERMIDPIGPTSAGSERVVRGGSWDDAAQSVRSASRDAHPPSSWDYDLGFRCVNSGRS